MNIKLNGNGFFRVTSEFHSVDSVHHTPHSGVDLAMQCGHKLFSPTDGVIEKVVNYGSQNIGKGIIIKTEDGERLILGHLSDNSSVHAGEAVNVGDYLGLTGTTGHSTGCHLHVGLRDASTGDFLNPGKYFNGSDIQHHIANIPEKVQQLTPGDVFHNAMSQFADSLGHMGLNLISSVSQLFDIHTMLQVLGSILSWIC
jgi:hypothetical protein